MFLTFHIGIPTNPTPVCPTQPLRVTSEMFLLELHNTNSSVDLCRIFWGQLGSIAVIELKAPSAPRTSWPWPLGPMMAKKAKKQVDLDLGKKEGIAVSST